MRLFLDTIVIISAMLFPNGRTAAFMRDAIEDHTVVIGKYVIEEFLTEFSCKIIDIPVLPQNGDYLVVRDPKDNPVLDSAIRSDCDYLITGDKDLTELEGVQRPIITNPGQFLDKK